MIFVYIAKMYIKLLSQVRGFRRCTHGSCIADLAERVQLHVIRFATQEKTYPLIRFGPFYLENDKNREKNVNYY